MRKKFPARPLLEMIEKMYPNIHSAKKEQCKPGDHYGELNMGDAAQLVDRDRRTMFRYFRSLEFDDEIVDRLCCNLLRVHPWEVYGDLWIEGGEENE